MKKTLTNISRKPVGIPYPPETKEKNVDFLIDDMLGGGVLPVEVSIHKEETSK